VSLPPATRLVRRSAGPIATRANLRRWPVTAAEAALRSARASAVLDGGGRKLDDQLDVSVMEDPVFAGALRVAQALEGGETNLVGVWQRAPLQALARLHMLAAADRVDESRLGRPRADADVGPRLELLTEIVTGATLAPAPVIAAVAHGELLTLASVRQRGRRSRARGVATRDHRDRPRPARPGCTGGGVDASRRRLP